MVLTFAQKLKALRKATGMTQQAMHELMLIPKRTIEDWERGISEPHAYVQRLVLNELAEMKGDNLAIVELDDIANKGKERVE